MESLLGVFSSVPTEALVRVLEICGQSVTVASTWLLENDWRDLINEEQNHFTASTTNVTSSVAIANETAQESTSIPHHNRTMVVSTEAHDPENNRQEPNIQYARRLVLGYQVQEDFDSDDEDEDDEEDDDDSYYDASVTGMPPLTKRMKVTESRETGLQAKADDFWVAFDGQVVVKSMIELLNTALSKLAHGNVVLLNQPVMELDRAAATKKLKSVLTLEETIDTGNEVTSGQVQSPRHTSNQVTVARMLNGDSPTAGKKRRNVPSSDSPTTSSISATPISQKRKRKEAAGADDSPCQGFFAHFFPVRELDTVWRTVMHTHLFKGQFGEKIEFHTASGGPFRKRDFDELMHLQNSTASSRTASIGLSPLSMLKCCLILPCLADEREMSRVGKNIYSILKVQGGLYYRVLDTPPFSGTASPCGDRHELLNEAEKMTEEQFRQFARYRIMGKEPITIGTTKVGADPYMSYQEPRKIKYCLEVLDASKWSTCLDD